MTWAFRLPRPASRPRLRLPRLLLETLEDRLAPGDTLGCGSPSSPGLSRQPAPAALGGAVMEDLCPLQLPSAWSPRRPPDPGLIALPRDVPLRAAAEGLTALVPRPADSSIPPRDPLVADLVFGDLE